MSLLPINQFAKKSGVTSETLRHYDRIGLLKPYSQNESGVRFYHVEKYEKLSTLGQGWYQEEGKEAVSLEPGKVIVFDFELTAEELAALRARWSNQVVAWSQLELLNYNVTNIMKDMRKPYLVVTAENAWRQPASREIFDAAKSEVKEWVVVPEASHFDMYDLHPFVDLAFDAILPFFEKNL